MLPGDVLLTLLPLEVWLCSGPAAPEAASIDCPALRVKLGGREVGLERLGNIFLPAGHYRRLAVWLRTAAPVSQPSPNDRNRPPILLPRADPGTTLCSGIPLLSDHIFANSLY